VRYPDKRAVLANKKDALIEKKGKNADIEKWEAELRKSLANKKTNTSTPMSKQDRALVDAQLAKEAQIRSRVAAVHRNLVDGLALLRSLIAAGVEDFRPHVWPMAALLLDGVLKRGSALVGQVAVDTYVVSHSSLAVFRLPLTPSLGTWNKLFSSARRHKNLVECCHLTKFRNC
jgi:hypothetical protein